MSQATNPAASPDPRSGRVIKKRNRLLGTGLKPRNLGAYGLPTYNQARKIVARFGGEAHLARLIGVARTTIYKWQYKRPYGSDGLIPSAQIEKIKAVARLEGILLRAEDWVPENNGWTPEERALANTKPRTRSLADLLA